MGGRLLAWRTTVSALAGIDMAFSNLVLMQEWRRPFVFKGSAHRPA